jgi:putative hydrolase of the HAD superfamily
MRKISMTSSNFLAYICNYFNIKLENDSFLNTVKELEELSVKNLARPVSGAVETLGKISLNYPDIKLAIISDTGFTPGSGLREILKKNRMIDFFQYLAFSDEIKRSKPSKKIFYAVYDALGVAPEDTIHMGDLEETDIRGAKMWGAKAVLFTGEKKGSTLPAQTGADYVINSFPELYNVVKYNF